MKRIKRAGSIKRATETPKARTLIHTDVPTGSIHMDTLVKLGCRRIALLQELEEALKNEEETSDLSLLCQKHMPLDSSIKSGVDSELQTREECLSHLILVLSCASSQALSGWLCVAEGTLFRVRYTHLLTSDEKKKMLEIYVKEMPNTTYTNNVFHVPFEAAISLLENRTLILNQGIAEVQSTDEHFLLSQRYEEALQQKLERARRQLQLFPDPRIERIAELLRSKFIVPSSQLVSGEELRTAGSIEAALDRFPPCMQRMHLALKRDSHLRHVARQQYGMFLKSLGLPLAEALLFWRHSFSRRFSPEEFESNYAYNIRHNYGQEGRRNNYPPHTCQNIISGNHPGNGEPHGCVFRELETPQLIELLQKRKLDHPLISRIMEKREHAHYQAACALLAGAEFDVEDVPPMIFPRDFYAVIQNNPLEEVNAPEPEE